MDCVTELGETAILYCADLSWRGMRASYSSVLLADERAIDTQSSMRSYRLTSSGDRISVEFPRLQAQGTWTAAAAPVQHTMYEDARGSVLWNCLQPGSTVQVTVGDRQLSGLGYAECLTLTLPPWQLPLRQLRWGRFVSPQDSLAWIDWQGPYSTRLAVHNGRKHKPVSVSDTEILLTDARLRLDQPLSLRSGRLGSTILPGAPLLRKLLPHSIFDIDEKKWRSRATLEAPDHQCQGWAIHEVVDWNC
jgi:predicted transcriptional regulator